MSKEDANNKDENTIKTLQEENKKLQADLSARDTTIAQLQNQLKALEAKAKEVEAGNKADMDEDTFNHISKLKEVIGIKDQRISKLEKDIETIQLENKKLLESIDKKENPDLCEHRLKLDSLQTKYSELETECIKWKEASEKQEEEHKAQLEAAKVLTEKLEQEQTLTNELKLKLSEEEKKVADLKAWLDKHLEEFKKSQGNTTQQAQSEINEIKSKKDAEIAEIKAQLEAALAELKKAEDSAFMQVNVQLDTPPEKEWEQKLAETTNELETAKNELAALNRKVQDSEKILSDKIAALREELKKHDDEAKEKEDKYIIKLKEKSLELETAQNKFKEVKLDSVKLQSALDRKEIENNKLNGIIKQLEAQKADLVVAAKKMEENMELLSGDLDIIKAQYKEQQNTLQKKEAKMEELAKLAEAATTSAEKYKGQAKERDLHISSLVKQLDTTKKQLGAAQHKVKVLSGNIMTEMTKQLEAKVKETEMLKEMLKSSKIELTGKEREVRRLRAKLNSMSHGGARVKVGGAEKSIVGGVEGTPSKPPVKSVSVVREPGIEALHEHNDAKSYSVAGDNFFFKQNYEDTKKLTELADMKDLGLERSMEEIKGIPELNIDISGVTNSPGIHLPPIGMVDQQFKGGK